MRLLLLLERPCARGQSNERRNRRLGSTAARCSGRRRRRAVERRAEECELPKMRWRVNWRRLNEQPAALASSWQLLCLKVVDPYLPSAASGVLPHNVAMSVDVIISRPRSATLCTAVSRNGEADPYLQRIIAGLYD